MSRRQASAWRRLAGVSQSPPDPLPPRVLAAAERILAREAKRLFEERLDIDARRNAHAAAGRDQNAPDQRPDEVASRGQAQRVPVLQRANRRRAKGAS